MSQCLSGVGRCATCGPKASTKSDSPFADDCPLTKTPIWRRAVSGDQAAANIPQPVLGGSVEATDGPFSRELLRVKLKRHHASDGDLSTQASSHQCGSPRSQFVFDFDERFAAGSELPTAATDGALVRVMQLLANQEALVKTVKNNGWEEFTDWLHGTRFRTPTTLPPAQGKSMRLFAEPRRAYCGLIWDLDALSLGEAYMWPSGYFAKTEFNVLPDGTLKEGREQALVTIEQLKEANDRLEYTNMGTTVIGQIMPYNEVLVHIEGCQGLVGVMARSSEMRHLLFAMGIRDMLAREFPALGQLPIIVHDPENGFRPFSRASELALLRSFIDLGADAPGTAVTEQWLPIDTRRFDTSTGAAGLSPVAQLRLHALFGLTPDALKDVMKAVQGNFVNEDPKNDLSLTVSDGFADNDFDNRASMGGHDTEDGSPLSPSPARRTEHAAFALLALDMAVETDNAYAAMSIVLNTVPQIFGDTDRVLTLHQHSDKGCLTECNPTTRNNITLRSLMPRAKSDGLRLAVGVYLALESFTNGHSLEKLNNACKLLEEWLSRAKSLSFRLQSCKDEKRSTEFVSFASDRIISNRTHFYRTLCDLRSCSDRTQFIGRLHELAQQLLHPCLRLQILQGILGLDSSYDRDLVVKVVKASFDLVTAIDNKTIHKLQVDRDLGLDLQGDSDCDTPGAGGEASSCAAGACASPSGGEPAASRIAGGYAEGELDNPRRGPKEDVVH